MKFVKHYLLILVAALLMAMPACAGNFGMGAASAGALGASHSLVVVKPEMKSASKKKSAKKATKKKSTKKASKKSSKKSKKKASKKTSKKAAKKKAEPEPEPTPEPEETPAEEPAAEEAPAEEAPAEEPAAEETPAEEVPADSASAETPAEEPAAVDSAATETPAEEPVYAAEAPADSVAETPADSTAEPYPAPEDVVLTEPVVQDSVPAPEAQVGDSAAKKESGFKWGPIIVYGSVAIASGTLVLVMDYLAKDATSGKAKNAKDFKKGYDDAGKYQKIRDVSLGVFGASFVGFGFSFCF